MSVDIRSLYTPMERALLAAYLQIPDPNPEDLVGLDPTKPVDPRTWSEHRDGIGPVASEGDASLLVENAVARICLESVESQLPQWAAISDGSRVLGRTPRSGRIQRKRELRPCHLFTINWGDSAPGFSWPEAYWVTALPGYEVCIVTGSADSPDAHGYCDFAIGWYRGRPDDPDAAGECIKAWWRAQASYGQLRWSSIFDEGEIDEATASLWADTIWTDEPKEDEG